MSNGSGSKEDPWVLKTPPGKSEYMMFKDEQSDPPALVCVVGSTKLTAISFAAWKTLPIC